MIPWDQVPLDKIEKQPHEFDKLVEKIKSLQLVISIGLHDDYLLVSITPSIDRLAALGQGPKARRPSRVRQARSVHGQADHAHQLHDEGNIRSDDRIPVLEFP